MRRSGLAVTAAVVLSLIPAAPPALANPFSVNKAAVAAESGSVIEVSHRRGHRRHCHRDIRRHYHGAIGRSAWHRHVGPWCRIQVVRRYHRPHHGGCIRIGDVRICF